MSPNPIPGYWAVRGRRSQVYNEAAFRHFLAVDRLQARQSQRSLFLVLVGIRDRDGRQSALSTGTASAIFRGLAESVREVDFVGWFREGRVPAALLMQGAGVPEAKSVAVRTAARVGSEVTRRLPSALTNHVRVRVVRLGARDEEWTRV
jgi:hypothetical protein